MKPLVVGCLACVFAFAQPASAAAPIVELRTNPACAQAFHQTVIVLKQAVMVSESLVPGSPDACRKAREIIRLYRYHQQLDTRMYAICHQDGATELATEQARTDHLQQVTIPRYCR